MGGRVRIRINFYYYYFDIVFSFFFLFVLLFTAFRQFFDLLVSIHAWHKRRKYDYLIGNRWSRFRRIKFNQRQRAFEIIFGLIFSGFHTSVFVVGIFVSFCGTDEKSEACTRIILIHLQYYYRAWHLNDFLFRINKFSIYMYYFNSFWFYHKILAIISLAP